MTGGTLYNGRKNSPYSQIAMNLCADPGASEYEWALETVPSGPKKEKIGLLIIKST